MLRLRIGEILDQRNISTSEFTRGTNIPYGTALNLRRGVTTRIDFDTLEKVCAFLGVTPNDVLVDEPKKNKAK